jgi:hypothetical protein
VIVSEGSLALVEPPLNPLILELPASFFRTQSAGCAHQTGYNQKTSPKEVKNPEKDGFDVHKI